MCTHQKYLLILAVVAGCIQGKMRRPEQSHASLEKELIVIEKTYGSDLADAPAAVKRRARMIKNRLSAKKSREQARE